ncbi:MAG: VWA domain-containing protein [Isosphaeraceae bacterium]
MNFAHPAALAWAALALPIVAFYILKIRLRRVPVSTSMFWDQIFEEKRPRSFWQHLRHLISLACQILLLALLVFALGEPLWGNQARDRRRVILILDNSASMSAADGITGRSRLDLAKEKAGGLVEALRADDEMAVISAGTVPAVGVGLTDHQGTLREAIARVAPTQGPTRVVEAIELARRLLAEHPNRRIVVLSDGGFDKAEELVGAEDITLMPVASNVDNLGIIRFLARRSLIDPVGYELLVEVENRGDSPAEARLDIDLKAADGTIQPLDAVALKLEADGKWSRVFEKVTASGGEVIARLNHADALAADNQAFALLPRRDRQKVTLVTPGNLFLEKVFEASPLVALDLLKRWAEGETATAGRGLVVFHRQVPETLPAGPLFVIDPRNACDIWDLGDLLPDPIVARQAGDSSLMTHVKLQDMVMPEAHKLTPRGPSKILAESPSGDPLLVAFDRPGGKGKVLVLLADLEQSELPLQTAFPILATNALGWFSGNQGELRESVASGSVVELELPATAGKSPRLKAPDGTIRDLPTPGGRDRTPIGPLDQVGIWQILATTEPNEQSPRVIDLVACNLADRRESDLRVPESWPRDTAPAIAAGWASRPIWFQLIALALAFAGVEWFLYQRRYLT